MNRDNSFPLAGLLLLTVCAASYAGFEPASFQKIHFADSCAHKSWLQTPDNSLQLVLPSSSEGPCEVTLEFFAPDTTAGMNALFFEAKSSDTGDRLRVELSEGSDQAPVQSVALPESGLDTDWQSLRVRFSSLQSGWHPAQISRIHFVVSPALGTFSTVSIRNLHWVTLTAATHSASHSHAPATPAAVPTLHLTIAFPHAAHLFHSALIGRVVKSLFIFSILMFFLIVLQRKNTPLPQLSPLYEINTRTWKSIRDKEGVIHVGGFKKITLANLQEIRDNGFSSVWFMGIWEIGPKVRDISRRYGPDFMGSPYAIYDYTLSSELGSEQDFQDLIQRTRGVGLKVFIDFIPNHMGLDSLWLNAHPEFFIHRVLNESEAALPDEELEQLHPGYFVHRTPSYPVGERRVQKTILVAYGRDPYFYPWIDTAQLDYANPGLRRKLIDVMSYWAKVVDGIRCDMAMLVLREQVKIHRHPEMSWETFNQLMPHEFWTEAIQTVKKINPHFVFMAETYWSMEGYLQQLGFDFTYNKSVYESINHSVHSGHAEALMNFLRLLGNDFMQKSVHFLENHDEERAMNSLGEERQKPAAVILSTLPGVALLHQGQLEGRRERLPVQRAVPLHDEKENTTLKTFYSHVLRATSKPVFQQGRLSVLYSNNSALVSYARVFNEEKALIVVNVSNKPQKGSIFLTPGLRLHSGMTYRLHDLFYGAKSVALQESGKVQEVYDYKGSLLINRGLYVELEPYDTHIFMVQPQGVQHWKQKAVSRVEAWMDVWPFNHVPKRLVEQAFTRFASDSHEVTDPSS